MTTIHYLVQRALGRTKADDCVRRLLDMVAVAPVDVRVLLAAARAGFADYEDAVVHEAALAWHADGIVTRDPGASARRACRCSTRTSSARRSPSPRAERAAGGTSSPAARSRGALERRRQQLLRATACAPGPPAGAPAVLPRRPRRSA